jgi:GNAT superfamily N-acetyltransferase
MRDVAIRRATAGDLGSVLAMVREFCEEEGRRYDEGHVRPALEPLLPDDTLGQVWLAGHRVDGDLGYAVLTWGWGLESGGREGLVDELFVAAGWRGHGVGGLLLDRVREEARIAGCRTLFLETERANDAARRLYRRHGLVEEDSVWMRAEL